MTRTAVDTSLASYELAKKLQDWFLGSGGDVCAFLCDGNRKSIAVHEILLASAEEDGKLHGHLTINGRVFKLGQEFSYSGPYEVTMPVPNNYIVHFFDHASSVTLSPARIA